MPTTTDLLAGDSRWFTWIQCGNALVSTTTAVYLIPLIPDMFTLLDTAVANLQNETKDSKSKLFTFMAFLCHEIRNPLFAITSSAECLQDSITTMADQVASEEVQSILDSSLLMLRLVNDVLDLSKLDSGKLQLECRQFDLHALLKRLGDNMGRQVRHKHQGAVDFECRVDASVPQFVLGDSVRMVQIIYNLLSNSLKFTSRGRISVQVAALESYAAWRRQQRDDADETNDTVTMSHHRPVAMFANKTTEDDDDEEAQVFSMALLSHNHHHHHHHHTTNDNKKVVLSIVVADTGIGIPHERLHDIFEPYTQAKLSDFRQHGGTGLGLSIISSLTKAMGGTINVTSRPGEGATFHLHLPVQLPEEQHTCNTNPLTTTASNKATNNNNMNYVGELLPNDQKQVSNNFLKCQRMPNWTHTSSQDLSSMISHQADADSNQNKDNIAHHETDITNGKESTTTLLQPPPLFSTTTVIPPPSKPSSPSTENMLDKQSMSMSERSKTSSSSSTAFERSRTITKSFNLPPNNHVVLVVDDNSVNRKILGKMLTTFGIEHRMACNGQEAVDALLASRNYLPATQW
ncbi:sensor kinase/phosphatase LuxQ [Seminavis robusta]|uniref:histidine kinase n=1 Tax=Seminavis robusta TaxID=568900 RepID=A0A9N8DXF3_9STRA|nr:sensor kinase/phosphatase LuxQ [Seminavis robusta]|eukprot:Sro419_g139190.1 sensor kinase/phosphatase LuxQ (575) ;mRNA; f:65127-67028